VAKKAGLAGKTEEEEIYADVILEHVNDFIKGDYKIQNMCPRIYVQYCIGLL
jgi:hypothetical protein